MTKKEFETLTGTEVQDEQYRTIEEMYMLAGNMDKRDFCANYMLVKNNDLYRTFFHELKKVKDELNQTKKALETAGQTMSYMGYDLGSDYLRDEGRKVLGDKEYSRYIVSHRDIDICDEDRKLIISLIR